MNPDPAQITSSTVFKRFAASAGLGFLFLIGLLLILPQAPWVTPLLLIAFLMLVLILGARAIAPLLLYSDVSLRHGPFGEQGIRSEDLQDSEWGDLDSLISRLKADSGLKQDALIREQVRWKSVLDSLEDALLIVDSDWRPVFWNSRFDSWFGGGRLSHAEPGALPGVRELFRSPEIIECFEESKGQRRSRRADLELHVSRELQPRSFRVDITPFSVPGSEEPLSSIAIFHDVTDLKRADQMRINFVANVSHELRTPLTSIRGYAETLAEDVGAGHYQSASQCVGVILRNVDRLGALVQDLLDLSQLESARERELEREWFVAEALSRRVLASLEAQRAAGSYQVSIQGGQHQVFADPARVEQVLVNLLGNAFKYVPAAGSIQLRWIKRDSAVVLEVADNGPGIPEEHLPRLFERFYRVDPDRSRATGGTGLGLAIVKHITQAHGGEVAVRSSPGEGTVFSCVFPLPRA